VVSLELVVSAAETEVKPTGVRFGPFFDHHHDNIDLSGRRSGSGWGAGRQPAKREMGSESKPSGVGFGPFFDQHDKDEVSGRSGRGGAGGGESVKREIYTERLGQGSNMVTRTTVVETRTTPDGRTQTTRTVKETKGPTDNVTADEVRLLFFICSCSSSMITCLTVVHEFPGSNPTVDSLGVRYKNYCDLGMGCTSVLHRLYRLSLLSAVSRTIPLTPKKMPDP